MQIVNMPIAVILEVDMPIRLVINISFYFSNCKISNFGRAAIDLLVKDCKYVFSLFYL